MSAPTRTSPSKHLTGDSAWRDLPSAHPVHLPVHFLFALTGKPGAQPARIVAGNHGDRRIFNVEHGSFEGPRMRGHVLPPSGDWARLSSRGHFVLDVRLALRTEDGADVLMNYQGYIIDGEYARVHGHFEVGDERYQWLDNVVFFGIGRFTPERQLTYRFFAVD